MLYSFSTIAIKTVLGYMYNIRPAGEINQLLVFNLKMERINQPVDGLLFGHWFLY